MAKRILIIEDEHDLAELVANRLRSEGFAVDICHDGKSGVERCLTTEPDLVVLDLMLPELDGLEVCRRIQQHRRTPVVMMTAKSDESDVLIGLGVGADDYITKPFSPRELAARVHAVLRRASNTDPERDIHVSGDVRFDKSSRTVTRHGLDVHLTATEFDLALTLVIASGTVLSREQLLQKVWGYRDGSGARTVDSHVRAVRRKLGDDLIRTVHGIGYASTPPVTTSPMTAAPPHQSRPANE